MEVKWLDELHIGNVSNVELDSGETSNERTAIVVCGVWYFLAVYISCWGVSGHALGSANICIFNFLRSQLPQHYGTIGRHRRMYEGDEGMGHRSRSHTCVQLRLPVRVLSAAC